MTGRALATAARDRGPASSYFCLCVSSIMRAADLRHELLRLSAASRLLAALLREHQRVLADQHDVAFEQRVPRDRLVVDEGAVGALQVLEHVMIALAIDARVAARHRGVVDDQHVVGQPPDA